MHPPQQTTPPTLADFFGVDIAKFALVIIDVQRDNCDPTAFGTGSAHTKAIATNIRDIKARFISLGIQSDIVHYDRFNQGFDAAAGGAYLITVTPNDIKSSK